MDAVDFLNQLYCRYKSDPEYYSDTINLNNMEPISFVAQVEAWAKAHPKMDDIVTMRHGRWEWLGPNELVRGCMCGTCSVCKVRSKYITNTAVCPNCGAKLDL